MRAFFTLKTLSWKKHINKQTGINSLIILHYCGLVCFEKKVFHNFWELLLSFEPTRSKATKTNSNFLKVFWKFRNISSMSSVMELLFVQMEIYKLQASALHVLKFQKFPEIRSAAEFFLTQGSTTGSLQGNCSK